MFTAFGSDSSTTFTLNPAVRSPSGACIEESNCNAERVTVCAFANDAGQLNAAKQADVDFLECMDKAEHGGDPVAQAKTCFKGDFSAVQSCYDGSQGDTLLQQASDVWNKAYPSRATVPCVQVNGVKVAEASYNAIKSAICAAGSTASAC